MYRIEKDSLGEKQIPANALYGIHAQRAKENFPGNTVFPLEWYKAVGTTKLACYLTYKKFRDAAVKKNGEIPQLDFITNDILDPLISAALEVADGIHYEHFIVPAVQGGAGTSINMNINEIITNSALQKSGHMYGDYVFIDPLEHANIFQSTNDVIPTALTIAVMKLLQSLEENINLLRQRVEKLEKANREKLRPGYTQMMEAVPSSIGLLFSTYNEALSRDWWRVSKCSERIKQVNLGGGAIGTGLSLPRFFIMEVVPELRNLTGLPVAHSENLSDATSNLDRWVEIHATLKAHAVNLEKISSDLRLLSSDVSAIRSISLPERQVGSTIMPGKINPVIPEFIISSSHKIYSNDVLISSLCSQGTLELNAYLPVIGYALIESINLLISGNSSLLLNLFDAIKINESTGYNALIHSPSATTALTPHIGYHKAAEIARLMKEKQLDIFEANSILNYLEDSKLRTILQPGNLLKLGFTLDDLTL
ncbi:MAG: aspartate ammonia-lyase [Bacteroidales bacterium]|nr:aspartate ammonia-lyase [Bacteroidales bacterium]MBK8883496.1 aspartate ammonia-lyase [Bacteroidales bacterium]